MYMFMCGIHAYLYVHSEIHVNTMFCNKKSEQKHHITMWPIEILIDVNLFILEYIISYGQTAGFSLICS